MSSLNENGKRGKKTGQGTQIVTRRWIGNLVRYDYLAGNITLRGVWDGNVVTGLWNQSMNVSVTIELSAAIVPSRRPFKHASPHCGRLKYCTLRWGCSWGAHSQAQVAPGPQKGEKGHLEVIMEGKRQEDQNGWKGHNMSEIRCFDADIASRSLWGHMEQTVERLDKAGRESRSL